MKEAETFIKNITKKAGNTAFSMFGKVETHHYKSVHLTDAVTKADIRAERVITSAIRKKYPSHGIVAEESGLYRSDAEYLWIIDPIDGTLDFASKIPLFGTMVALARNGRVELACIYLPCTKELAFAKRGHGAFLNGKRMRCSVQKEFHKTKGFLPSSLRASTVPFIQEFIARTKRKSCSWAVVGSAAVQAVYVADGRGGWLAYKGIGGTWDAAAPSLILEEAGCKVTNVQGKPWRVGDIGLIAGSAPLHTHLLSIAKKSR